MENVIDISAVDCAVAEELKSALQNRIADLTMLPSIANEAIALSNDPDADSKEFAQVVERDIALATQMLSVANSPIFSGGAPISNLHQAVLRLGFEQCRNLIISSSAACLVKRMKLTDEWVREVIWQHSFNTATLATAVSRTLNLEFEGEEFAAGLLHDFGRLLLAVAMGEQYPKVDTLNFFEDEEVVVHEREVIGTDHCCFGAWFAKEAGLPADLIEVIRFHHSLEPNAQHSKLVSLVIAADDMANYLQRNEVVSDYPAAANPGILQLEQHYGKSLVTRFETEAVNVLLEVENSNF